MLSSDVRLARPVRLSLPGSSMREVDSSTERNEAGLSGDRITDHLSVRQRAIGNPKGASKVRLRGASALSRVLTSCAQFGNAMSLI